MEVQSMKCRKLGVIETRFAELIWSHAPISVVELEALCRQEFEWKKPATHMMLERLCAQGLFQNTDGMVGVLLSCEEFSASQSEQAVVQPPKFALRPFISACPLAFGETGVKGRIQSVLNYKKPAVWVAMFAVVLCAALALCALTEPVGSDEFPGVYYDVDDDGVSEYCYINGYVGSGIVNFHIVICEPNQSGVYYHGLFPKNATDVSFLTTSEGLYLQLVNRDGTVEHQFEVSVEDREVVLSENGKSWRNNGAMIFDYN